MKKIASLLLFSISLFSINCKEVKTESSPELTERARVVDVIFQPSNHGSGVGPTFDLTGNGGLGIAITSVDIPEKYAVVFECQHGKFIIQGDQQKAKELWQRLKRDQQVTVRYKEVYETTYEDGRALERHLTKYDFVDAR